MQSLTALNSSRVMTLFMSESNWLNRFRMATKPDETRSSSLGLPSAVTFKQQHQCQGSVFSATVQARCPTRVSEAASQGERASELRALGKRTCARPSAVLGRAACAGRHGDRNTWQQSPVGGGIWQGLQHGNAVCTAICTALQPYIRHWQPPRKDLGCCQHAESLLTLMAAKPWPGALAAASMLFMKMRMWASQSASLP